MKIKSSSIVTYGCTHNQKDSQIIQQKLVDTGIKIVSGDEWSTADLIIVNSCTVKSPTENKILHFLDKISQSEKKVLVVGCLSQSNPKMLRERYPNFTVLGVNAIRYLDDYFHKKATDFSFPVLDPSSKSIQVIDDWIDKTLLPSVRWNNNLEIVQINEGCVNSCTFCATKFARGRLRSSSRESIIRVVKSAKTPEIWLTSQDTGCWGFDIDDSLDKLLNKLDEIEGKFWIRVGMANPNNIIKNLDKLIEAFSSPKIYKFLHIPLQSGSNSVLKHMKRGYDVNTYHDIIDSFRKKIPKITISTDVICGYPTEKETDFEDTLTAVTRSQPDICNISRFWERKNTKAAELVSLPHSIRKERSFKLYNITRKIQRSNNEKWLNWSGEILCNELGAKGGIQARNKYYKPIIIRENVDLGSWRNAKITGYTDTYLIGELK